MTSLFELFKIGIGPSSSHTVGPMRAALRFLREHERDAGFDQVERVQVDLYGSLALTGKGHGTDNAILLGLWGHSPDTVPIENVDEILRETRERGEIWLQDVIPIRFWQETDLLFHRDQMYPDANAATHPNGVRFSAYDKSGVVLATEVYYS